MVDVSTVILLAGVLVFLAHLFTSLFERTRIPDVLPLVFIGILVGPLLGLVTPTSFGSVGNVFVVITLVIILFESGLGLNFSTLRDSLVGGIRLTLINFVITSAVVAFISIPLFGMTVIEGLMLGSILGGTSSAVVIPMINKLRLQPESRTILLLESTFSDVLCIVVTLALVQTVQYNSLRIGSVLGQIIASFLLAAMIGSFFAWLWSSLLERIRQLENSIFLTPAFVFIIYGITELLGYSGAISALAFGFVLGNIKTFKSSALERGNRSDQPITLNETEKTFFSEVTFLLKTFFFVYIGISINLDDWTLVFLGLILTIVIFILRIPTIHLSADKKILKFDASLMGVIVPKGLAAAVLASLPLQVGVTKGIIIQDVVYVVILFTITITAILAFLIERGILQKPYELIFHRYTTENTTNR